MVCKYGNVEYNYDYNAGTESLVNECIKAGGDANDVHMIRISIKTPNTDFNLTGG